MVLKDHLSDQVKRRSALVNAEERDVVPLRVKRVGERSEVSECVLMLASNDKA